jgi:hypothetical protein
VCAVTKALTVTACAARLGLSQRQLRYAIAQGAPIVRRGRKGRGDSATLVDPQALSDWLAAERDRGEEAPRRKLAAELIHAVADTTVLQFRMESGPHKAALLTSLIANFYATAGAIREQLGLPPLEAADVPEVIGQMDRARCQFRSL